MRYLAHTLYWCNEGLEAIPMKHSIRVLTMSIMTFSALSLLAWAGEQICQVCNMKIPEGSRHHIILKSEIPAKAPLHVCSISCVLKARKHDPKYVKVEVADFNHPEKFLRGEKAFVLIKTDKIKEDLDSMAMPPYFAAFPTKADAEKAKAKYGEGSIVEGFENALK